MTEQQFNNQFFRKGMKVKLNSGDIEPILGVDFLTGTIHIGSEVWISYSKCEVYYNELLDLFRDIVCKHFGINEEEIRIKNKKKVFVNARAVLMIMAIDSCKYSQRQIAQYMGLSQRSSVSNSNIIARHLHDNMRHIKAIKIEYGHLIPNINTYKCFQS